MTVRNVSGRGIQGYAFETIFTDPASGERVGPHRSHSTYKQPSLGAAIASGAKQEVAKPYPVPITAYGAPGNCSFNIDLVVFEDGTTWGPGHYCLQNNYYRESRARRGSAAESRTSATGFAFDSADVACIFR